MKEMLEQLEHIPLEQVRKATFIDTCFLLDELRHHKGEELDNLHLLSFNAQELIHVAHKIPDMKHTVRAFLKQHPVKIVDVNVHPGNQEAEEKFVRSVEPKLLELIADPSDAVLLAAALQTHSVVLTKDKHHLFTTTLENYLEQFHIRVFKEMKDYLLWKNS